VFLEHIHFSVVLEEFLLFGVGGVGGVGGGVIS